MRSLFASFSKQTFSSKRIYNQDLYHSNKQFSASFDTNSEFNPYKSLLYDVNLKSLLNSMHLIRRDFETLLFIGPNPALFLRDKSVDMKVKNFIYCDVSEDNLARNKKLIDFLRTKVPGLPENCFAVKMNNEKLPVNAKSLDAIINNFNLHATDNLEVLLRSYSNFLVPDGLFAANSFGPDSFYELRLTLSQGELEREGGVSPNVLIFPLLSEIGNLLQKTGYNLPTMNVTNYRCEFRNLFQIFDFLKVIGETNFLSNRRKLKSRESYVAAAALYQHLFNLERMNDMETMPEDGRGKISLRFSDLVDKEMKYIDLEKEEELFLANSKEKREDDVMLTIEVASIVAWKYSDTQQKPKERGSAEINLKDLGEDLVTENDEVRYGRIRPLEGNEDEFVIEEMTDKIKKKIKERFGEKLKTDKEGTGSKKTETDLTKNNSGGTDV